MDEPIAGPIHAFLTFRGPDGNGRNFAEVLSFSDAQLESVHDYIQWLFPLREPSRAVPGSPVLGEEEADAIRRDSWARDNLWTAALRMNGFYIHSKGWLRPYDHNHLRITRILTCLRALVGIDAARTFHDRILSLAAGSPVNPESLEYWRRAVED
ncbi:opioid growth factor receptor-related protein [Methylobacterium sp. EM32]|uniref:opioid growth factor receptor-related protein n=1 Tax=Methylobacterium sp. EM32 TaxID=3163481 RepID=UPI0033A9357F